MDDETCNLALRNALTEIKNAYTEMNWAFILKSDGEVVTSEEDTYNSNITKTASSFQTLMERASAVGGLDNMVIDGEDGKVSVSSVNNMYLVAGLAKSADLICFRTITNAVLPTIIKILDKITLPNPTPAPTPIKPTPIPNSPPKPSFTPTPTPSSSVSEPSAEREQERGTDQEVTVPETDEELETGEPSKQAESETHRQMEDVPSQQLIVDRYGGLMVKSDQIQLDSDVLRRWSSLLNGIEITEVDIESFSGKAARCRAKVINDSKLEGRGLIRIPEKTCQALEVRRGELVRVKPVVPEEEEEEESD